MPRISRLFWALALIGASVSASSAETLTPGEMRTAGFLALNESKPDEALQIADALLGRDPHDATAMILRSRALRDLARYGEAKRQARQAWAESKDAQQQYGSAMAMAQALSSSGSRTLAQLWLRRAVQVAPTPVAHDIAVRDFQYVRSRNPWSVAADFSAAPSSNVNGGSSNSSIHLPGLGGGYADAPFELSGDARALSGYQTAIGFNLRYRLPPTETRTSEIRFGSVVRHYLLSSAAQRVAPEAKGSNYDYALLELGWQGQTRMAPDKPLFTYGITGGRDWYGWSPLSNNIGFDGSIEKALTPTLGGRLRAFAVYRHRLDDDIYSNVSIGASARATRLLSNGDLVGLTFLGRNTNSDSGAITNTAYSVDLDWTKSEPIAGMYLSADLAYEWQTYPDFPELYGDRSDRTLTGSISVSFEKFQYYGFAPVITVVGTKTTSTVDLYDTQQLGMSLGFRSVF